MPDASWADVPRLRRERRKVWLLGLVLSAIGPPLFVILPVLLEWYAPRILPVILLFLVSMATLYVLGPLLIAGICATRIGRIDRQIEPREYRSVTVLRAIGIGFILLLIYTASGLVTYLFLQKYLK